MIGKILSHLLGNSSEEASEHTYDELMELEEEGWVIVDLPEAVLLSPEVDPLENLLIEHPSMSVYQMRCGRSEAEEEEEEEEREDEEETSNRSIVVRRHISWHLAAWGLPLPCDVQLLAAQRARVQSERKKLGRGVLQRQNLSRLPSSPAEKRYGHFKQPCQRLHNY
ncbi:tumor protein p53-inducible nuclear protein 2 [Betta splendens]|uniref:Tumor protein p53-inducible nuclear protein 2 n=1 Tax=Betta splendens TaxID=158456 RepID=A0A6P7M3I0_BETSP|nr:tumor protein p53-inducible nuclear protein 2 [Betta splendens]XP_029000767.1 tumor protein p53-inducible nuclear protein 2 [Betta splendens]